MAQATESMYETGSAMDTVQVPALTAPVPAESRFDLLTVLDAVSKFCLVAAFVLLLPVVGLTIAQAALGYHSYALESAEMEPSISAGSLIISHPTKGDNLHRGDIIAFHPPQDARVLVTHRVVDIRPAPTHIDGIKSVIVTKGDSSLTVDPWLIPSNAVVDREVLSVPVVGYPAAALQTKVGRFFFLVLPASLLTLVFFGERQRTARRRRRRRVAVAR